MSGLQLGRVLSLALSVAVLAACTGAQSSQGSLGASLKDSYIPLYKSRFLTGHYGGALVVAPHIAVTNDHNGNLIPENIILAHSREYDLLFFRTDHQAVPPIGSLYVGQNVIAYGQNGRTRVNEAKGVVRSLDTYVPERCPGCPVQRAMAYDAEGGEGFSGGPVVDAASGALLGITFGFENGKGEGGGRRMYAYDMDVVMSEMYRLLDNRAP
jgi:hypothetical protein